MAEVISAQQIAAPRSLVAALLFLAATLSVSPSHAAESIYTKLDLDACTVLERHEDHASVRMVCEGHANHPVYITEGDLRFDVDYGIENSLWESFGPFNTLGETIEWRVQDGWVYAAILRYFLDTGMTGGAEDKGQALVVSKVSDGSAPGCVVAVIDAAVEQANGVARGAAAMAGRFRCGDPTIAIGPEGSFVFSFTGAVSEGR